MSSTAVRRSQRRHACVRAAAVRTGADIPDIPGNGLYTRRGICAQGPSPATVATNVIYPTGYL